MKPPKLFHATAEMLYGELWRCALARDLGINDRTVRRYAAGQSAIPRHIWVELAGMCRRHCDDLYRAAENISRAMNGEPVA